MMKLSLSVRVAEAFDNKEKSTLPFSALVGLAVKHGYRAMCMRASVAGVHTPAEVVADMRAALDQAKLDVSMVTGDIAVPSNSEFGPDGLRHITPYLDLARRFGAPLIRVCLKREEDIYWARRAADEARERGIRLAHQCHCASLFETVEGAGRTLDAIGRENFGLIYEPANWFIVGEPYGAATIRRLEKRIFNVYVQNHTLTPPGQSPIETYSKGVIRVNHIGIWETGGVNFDEVLGTLKQIRYAGFVTIHQAFAGVMGVEDSVARSARYLKQYAGE